MSLASNKKWRVEWTTLLAKKDTHRDRVNTVSYSGYITLVQVSCQEHHYCVDL